MYVKQDGEKRQKCSRSKYKPEKNKSNKFYKFENKEIQKKGMEKENTESHKVAAVFCTINKIYFWQQLWRTPQETLENSRKFSLHVSTNSVKKFEKLLVDSPKYPQLELSTYLHNLKYNVKKAYIFHLFLLGIPPNLIFLRGFLTQTVECEENVISICADDDPYLATQSQLAS